MQWQLPLAVGIGLAIMVVGTMLFIIGQTISSRNKVKARKWFIAINIWVLSLIPYTSIFNLLGRFIRLAPTYGLKVMLGNPLIYSGVFWIIYIMVCAVTDLIVFMKK